MTKKEQEELETDEKSKKNDEIRKCYTGN